MVQRVAENRIEWRRKGFHVFNCFCGIALYLLSDFGILPKNFVFFFLGTFVLLFLLSDILRNSFSIFNQFIYRNFSFLIRESERKGLTALTQGLGVILILILVLPSHASVLMMGAAGLADPAGAIVGTKIGKRKINDNTSVAGSTAVFATTIAVALATNYLIYPMNLLSASTAFLYYGSVGFVGAFAEAAFPKLNDNLIMPLMTGVAFTAIDWLFGAPMHWGPLVQLLTV